MKKHFLRSLFPALAIMTAGCASTGSSPHTGDAADLAKAAARDAEVIGRPQRIDPLPPEKIPENVRANVNALYAGVGQPPPEELSHFHSILAKSPDLMRAYLDLATYMFRGKLPVRDRELALLRTAWITKAPYEWGEHVKVFKRLGQGTDDEVQRIIEGSSAPGWSEHDRAVLQAVEELTANAMIGDATWAILAKTWDEPQLIEFPILIGRYVGVAFTLNSLRVQLEPGNPGLTAR